MYTVSNTHPKVAREGSHTAPFGLFIDRSSIGMKIRKNKNFLCLRSLRLAFSLTLQYLCR